MSPEQQAQVWQRLWTEAQQTVPQLLLVTDAALLKSRLESLGIRHHPKAPPEAWALDLLRAGCEHIRDLSAYGLKPTAKGQAFTPAALFNELTRQLL